VCSLDCSARTVPPSDRLAAWVTTGDNCASFVKNSMDEREIKEGKQEV